ncbi:MAG TPA: saccharopine dehydrogenase NADP-binding domain-containing protein, partial [Myxococcota bacterium]|nr:saccharopine dehydrogenase NADP-binding domain-containing protein [Myxococcota bacterium]
MARSIVGSVARRIESVLVLGARGALGSRVARQLRAGLAGARVLVASRAGEAALGPGARRADVRDEASLARALDGVELVVNAVGPYAYDPAPIVRACLAARAAYVDLAEEPAFTAALYRAVAAGADAADAVFVPGCSTVPGLVEVVAQAFAPLAGLACVDAWLSLGSANPASAGLLAGLLHPLGRPAPDGEVWFGRVVAHEVAGRRLAFGRYPSGLPRERLRVGARELPLRFHAGFDRALLTRALRLAAPALARLPSSSAPALARALAPAARVARLVGTPRGALLVEARDTAGRRLGGVE